MVTQFVNIMRPVIGGVFLDEFSISGHIESSRITGLVSCLA